MPCVGVVGVLTNLVSGSGDGEDVEDWGCVVVDVKRRLRLDADELRFFEDEGVVDDVGGCAL